MEQHRLDQRKSMHSSAEDLAARALETERKRRKIRKEPSDEWKKHAENAAALAAQAKTERLHERLQEISKELRAIRAVKTPSTSMDRPPNGNLRTTLHNIIPSLPKRDETFERAARTIREMLAQGKLDRGQATAVIMALQGHGGEEIGARLECSRENVRQILEKIAESRAIELHSAGKPYPSIARTERPPRLPKLSAEAELLYNAGMPAHRAKRIASHGSIDVPTRLAELRKHGIDLRLLPDTMKNGLFTKKVTPAYLEQAKLFQDLNSKRKDAA